MAKPQFFDHAPEDGLLHPAEIASQRLLAKQVSQRNATQRPARQPVPNRRQTTVAIPVPSSPAPVNNTAISSSTPSAETAGAAGSSGSTGMAADAGHVHALAAGTGSGGGNIATGITSATDGASANVARADHTHAFNAQAASTVLRSGGGGQAVGGLGAGLLFGLNTGQSAVPGFGHLTAGDVGGIPVGGVLTGTLPNPSGLSSTGVTPGTYGDASHVAQVTVGADGRVTAASNVVVSGGGGGSSYFGSGSNYFILPWYQATPILATFNSGPLLVDFGLGDVTSGYSGGSTLYKTGGLPTGLVEDWLCNQDTGTTMPAGQSSPANDLTLYQTGSTQYSWGVDSNGPFTLLNTTTNIWYNTNVSAMTGTGDFSAEVVCRDDGSTLAPGFANWVFTCYDDRGSNNFIFACGKQNTGSGTSYRLTVEDNAVNVASVLSTSLINGLVHFLISYVSSTKTFTAYINGSSVGMATLVNARNSASSVCKIGLGNYGPYNLGGYSDTWEHPVYWAGIFNHAYSSTEVTTRYTALTGGVGQTAVFDFGANGFGGVSSVFVTRGWANTLSEALQYSSDGLNWTSVSLSAAPAHSGAFSNASITVSVPGAPVTARYWRYYAQDNGGTNSCKLSDFRLS